MSEPGVLGKYERELLVRSMAHATTASREFRLLCLEMVDKSSFREVERVTLIGKNVLQRWKREESK